MIKKLLWILVIISLFASIPLISDRYHTETSTKGVEVVVDYAEIQKVTSKVYNTYTEEQIMSTLKNNGVTTIAFYEQTLRDLVQRGIVNIYNTSDELVRSHQGNLPLNETLVNFNDKLNPKEINIYELMIRKTFKTLATDYSWNGKKAILINRPFDSDLQNIFIGLDLNAIQKIQTKYGFHVLARLNSDRPWDQEFLDWQFAKMNELGVKKLVFEGKNVLGNTDPENLKQTAEWMKAYDMSFGLVDFYDQAGYKTLGQLNGFRTFRVLSVSNQKATSDTPQETADVYSLGIKERDVRMIYIHMPLFNTDQIPSKDIMDKTTAILQLTKQGISDSGLIFKETKPMSNPSVNERAWQNLLLIIGLLSLISLCAEKFYRPFIYLPLPGGLVIYVLGQLLHKEILVFELFALLGAITAPTLSTILAIDWLKNKAPKRKAKGWSILLFILSSVISWYGIIVVVSLLNNLVFVQYLEQFRGVKALYFVPILLIALYLIRGQLDTRNFWELPVRIFNHPLYVKHLVIAGIAVIALGYFLSRSGNAATTLPFELQVRQWLNHVMGVRPRTKEIFLGHPFFIFGSYLFLRYRKGLWIFIVGVIGQMSMVSTFTHIHTPVLISIQRTINGMVIGIIVGFVLILVWEWICLFFDRWKRGNANA